MFAIFSVHSTFGIVEPQFSSEQIADIVDLLATQYGLPIGPGMAVVIPRPAPENEEEEVMQAISPGTHEVNIIFDFDPNDEYLLDMLAEDNMLNKYNVANQLCSTILFGAFHALNTVPTYFHIKIGTDYVTDELYEKMRKHRFNL